MVLFDYREDGKPTIGRGKILSTSKAAARIQFWGNTVVDLEHSLRIQNNACWKRGKGNHDEWYFAPERKLKKHTPYCMRLPWEHLKCVFKLTDDNLLPIEVVKEHFPALCVNL